MEKMSKSVAVVISRNGVEEDDGLQLHELLEMLSRTENPPVQLLFHTEAVSLVTKDSPIVGKLRELEKRGVHMLTCSTCLSYMGLRDRVAVGKVCGIERMTEAMESADTVVAL
jgi:intracellular sulfur oxidation DsrE/DsrF family protein